MINLKTGTLELNFCAETGALTELHAPGLDWPILNRPGLGLSWRLLVPLNEELRNNDVLGEKQKFASKTVTDTSVSFVWENPVSERGGVIDATITLNIRAEDGQAVYYMHIDNRSPYVIENVYCPYLGDVQRPKEAEWLKTFSFHYASTQEYSVWPHFSNLTGYFGTDYPTLIHPSSMSAGTPMTPYFLIRAEGCGLYAGIKAPSCELTSWAMELRPGYGSSINHMVPKVDNIGGKPVHTRFAALHVPYILPGESRSLTPVALEAYKGGWQAGVDVYKKWRDTWMKPAASPKWAQDVHSWQQLHINSPEDELRLRFTELPKVAETCKKHGVDVIQLVGWNDGGQDQGNPSHSPDPRLGTFDELKEAIAKCHAMGIKVVLFSKFTWADSATQWFKDELSKLAVKDPYGDYYAYTGYKYQTGTQLLDINTKRLIPMCFLAEEYLKVCDAEFMKMVDLGAAGMLFDECLHHSPALLCFDKNHGHRMGAPVYENDRGFVKRLQNLPGVPADFLMAGEACYDWLMDAYPLSYHRSENWSHIPLSRYMLPHAQFMTAVTGFDDRNMINQCLLCRYIISYEPYNFKGSLDDYPLTVEYGKKMDALRKSYRKWFWDGEYRDTCGAKVTNSNGESHHPYAVYKADDSSQGLVIANYGDKPIAVTVQSEEGYVFSKYRTVEDDAWHIINKDIAIEPLSAVIVL